MKPWQSTVVVGCLFAMGTVHIEAAEFRAGAAAVRITPDKPTPLAGYYNTRIPTNTHDELQAKAIVLEQDGVRAALVVCDLLTLSRDVVERTREIVSRTTGVPGANVMLSATHTHTGPLLDNKSSRNITDSSSAGVIREYTESLPARIAESVRLAEAALQPARVAVAHEREDHLSHNRRFFMKDGTVGWNPGKLNMNIVRAAGPIDPDVALVYFDSPRGVPIGTYVNFAMHPDTVGGLEFSADYAFTLSKLLGDYKGTNMVTVFANGACGNINHVDVNWAGVQKGHVESARLGTILAGNVLKGYTRMTGASAGALRVQSEMVKLPLPELKPGDVESARALATRVGTTNAPKFLEQVNAFRVLDVAARNGRPQEVEVQVITLGDDVAWVSLPGEIFVELGLEIKEKSPFRHTLIAELANGSIGYIPNKKAYEQGNYEPTSARCAQGSGEILVESALKFLRAARRDK
jgi:neutral ceramidase